MKIKYIIPVHVIFWSVTLVSTGLQTIPLLGNKPLYFIASDYFIYTVSFVSFFYLFYFFISIKHLDKKKIIFLIISGLLFTLIITIPITYIYIYLLFENVLDMDGKKFLLNFGKYYISFFETNFMFAVSGSLLKIALLWYENIIKQKESEKQLIAGELALLRSQINPRFLFHTLTFIKSLIETKPEKAIYSIENLSEIMSYMLYETSAGKVRLDDEISYINNYLNLQRVRYYPENIGFEVTGNTAGIMVPPLLFMPFLEYAFKVGENISMVPGINIMLSASDNNLLFEVINSLNENNGSYIPEDTPGIKSIERWLDLQFGKDYRLEIKKDDYKNYIKLDIKLTP